MKKLILILPLVACLAFGEASQPAVASPTPTPDPKIVQLEAQLAQANDLAADLKNQRDTLAQQLLDTQLQLLVIRRASLAPTPTPAATPEPVKKSP